MRNHLVHPSSRLPASRPNKTIRPVKIPTKLISARIRPARSLSVLQRCLSDDFVAHFHHRVMHKPSPWRKSCTGLKFNSVGFVNHLHSSPRFSRWPLKPGFGEINITLDPAQGLVVDGFFVAQFDHGVAFCL